MEVTMLQITMTNKTFTKVGNKWVLQETEVTNITKEFYDNVVNSAKFFRNLGGYERHTKSYTCIGYIVTHINSINPDRTTKVTRDFKFEHIWD